MNVRILLVLVFLLQGCASSSCYTGSACGPDGDCLMQANYHAVDQLLGNIPAGRDLNRHQPIIVASLVNIDDLGSSRLGRMVSEQLATRLTRNGYGVVELKLRGSIFVKKSEGELLLSREIKDITLSHKAQAVLVGTYTESRGQVYVTVKLVGMGDNMAISAYDYVLPLDGNVRSMLWSGGRTQQN